MNTETAELVTSTLFTFFIGNKRHLFIWNCWSAFIA